MAFPKPELVTTTVKNNVNKERSFTFLGTRGMRLAANEVVTIPGNLIAELGAQAAKGDARKYKSLLNAMQNETITVRSVPSPILYDVTDTIPSTLTVDNGAVASAVIDLTP